MDTQLSSPGLDQQHRIAEGTPEDWQIGTSRPALEVDDLPTPEEVFKAKRIGFEELILLVLGPAVIALGVAIGSGEWLFSPLEFSQHGFKGLGWVILVSALLQVFYTIELGRFTLATGETPVQAFGRTPPGYLLWVPLAMIGLYLAFVTGEWAVNAGISLFSLLTGRIYNVAETNLVHWIGILLMIFSFLILMIGRKVERTLEIIQGTLMAYVLLGLLLTAMVVVPFDNWKDALTSILIPSVPPQGTNITLLGTLAGFTALASGLNFMVVNYYRDKGYGMSHKVGYISGLLGGAKVEVSPVGKTFPENSKNAMLWKRWFRYLLLDQWGIFFIGALMGILLPAMLVNYFSHLPGGQIPTQGSMVVYASEALGSKYGPLAAGWMLLSGFFILYSTQLGILDLLTRNLSDTIYSLSATVRQWVREDIRRLFYPVLGVVIIVVSLLMRLSVPENWTVISANISNLAAMVFPLITIYLNRQLPKPARISWWSYLVLIANFVFFGFFFLNFVVVQFTGEPIVRF